LTNKRDCSSAGGDCCGFLSLAISFTCSLVCFNHIVGLSHLVGEHIGSLSWRGRVLPALCGVSEIYFWTGSLVHTDVIAMSAAITDEE